MHGGDGRKEVDRLFSPSILVCDVSFIVHVQDELLLPFRDLLFPALFRIATTESRSCGGCRLLTAAITELRLQFRTPGTQEFLRDDPQFPGMHRDRVRLLEEGDQELIHGGTDRVLDCRCVDERLQRI